MNCLFVDSDVAAFEPEKMHDSKISLTKTTGRYKIEKVIAFVLPSKT